jgi:hypothetical protein
MLSIKIIFLVSPDWNNKSVTEIISGTHGAQVVTSGYPLL